MRVRWWQLCLVGVLAACSGDDGGEGRGGAGTSGAAAGSSAGAVGGEAGAGGAGGAAGTPGACPDTRRCKGGLLCCDAGQECVDGLSCEPICETERCGNSSLMCCDADQVCLDGVLCAASCKKGRALCGKKLDTCCDASDVCLNDACETPGIDCGDDFDCLDTALYCEHALGQCLETPADVKCEVRPDFDEIAVEVEWHWQGVDVGGTFYANVIDTPAVGDITGDGIPDVVTPVYAGSDLDKSILVALDGADGTLHWTISGADTAAEQSAVAMANFDADPELEFVYRMHAGGIRLMQGDGVTEIARRTTGGGLGARVQPAIADLDGDGTPDIVMGCHAMNGLDIANAALDFFDNGNCSDAPAIANLDDDPEPEITTGGNAFDIDGNSIWSVTGSHGFPAVADLDLDGKPEVVNVQGGTVIVRDGATGTVLVGPGGTWADGTFSIPGGGTGGPPTVADFDGDGAPEIASAGQAAYVVYDPDCLPTPPRKGAACGTTDFILWQTPTQDISSSVTGSSVFDFQGDGAAEVIYNDECFLHVYNGTDGSEPLAQPVFNSSRTSVEYPIVVDVDRDGNSEIVVPANHDQAVSRDNCPTLYAARLGVTVGELPPEIAAGTQGVFVFGDPNDRWVGTRPIWNEYTYHVTNVTDQGDVPATEPDNWATPGLNDYRKNVQGAGVFNAPNLAVELEAVAVCREAKMRLSAVIKNAGSRGTPPGVSVVFTQTKPKKKKPLAEKTLDDALLPGQSARVTVTVDIPVETDLKFEVEVDGENLVVECVEDDNTATAKGNCPGVALD